MKAVILDGSNSNDVTGDRVRRTLINELRKSGWDTEPIIISSQKIRNCAGDFFCWVRDPGRCHLDDDNRRIARTVISSDLMVCLTPVTFGGYSSILKRAVDHLIQNISPFFTSIDGETHHEKRYAKYPDFLVIGWRDSTDEHSEVVFKHLVKRNAINLYAEKTACGIFTAGQPETEIAELIKGWLHDLEENQVLEKIQLKGNGDIRDIKGEIRRALLLVGSPQTRKSTSNSLGEYLFRQFDSGSIRTEAVYLYNVIQSSEGINALLETIDAVDLVTLAFPLYVDSLPAPVIDVLERIAADGRNRPQTHRPLFAAIANCGFPEAIHNTTAMAICEIFAEQAGFQWAGGLALGGGAGLGEKPLPEWGNRTLKIRNALELAAAALARSQSIPEQAKVMMSRQFMPSWSYRVFGGFAWKQQAKKYGMQKSLRNQPYL